VAFRECRVCGRNDRDDGAKLHFVVLKVDKRRKENKGKEDFEIYLCDIHYAELHHKAEEARG
jgi:hypothetical protein